MQLTRKPPLPHWLEQLTGLAGRLFNTTSTWACLMLP